MIRAGKKKDSWLVKCECCESHTLAEILLDRIIIKDRRHGKKHVAIITIPQLLDKMNFNGYNGGNNRITDS